jgi:dipeptidyl aminopeptidase/acylaminoacyl peptidase
LRAGAARCSPTPSPCWPWRSRRSCCCAPRRDPPRSSPWTWPVFLPDGKRFVCHVRGAERADSLFLVDLDGRARPIIAAGSKAHYVDPGYLLYVVDGALLAHPFDPGSGRPSGSPIAVTDGVAYFLSTGHAKFSSSLDGTLVYSTMTESGRLQSVDLRNGAATTIGAPGNYLDVEISPDGTRAMFSRGQPQIGTYDIWSLDLASGTEGRVTTNRNSEFAPVWLPGQTEIIYSANLGRTPWLHRLDLRTGTARLLRDAGFEIAGSVTPDGRTLLFAELSGTDYDIWRMPLDGSGPTVKWLATPFTEVEPILSPDGRHLAFVSNESGSFEAYVAPFPGPGEKIRMSANGANSVRWNHATGALIYLDLAGRLLSVPLGPGGARRAGLPEVLATAPRDVLWRDFDITPDGRRALVVVADRNEARRPIEVLVHWPRTLKK